MAISKRDAERAIEYMTALGAVRDKFSRIASMGCDSITIGSFEIGETSINSGTALFNEAKLLLERALLERASFLSSWLRDNGFDVQE
jgi:hypothetical protein